MVKTDFTEIGRIANNRSKAMVLTEGQCDEEIDELAMEQIINPAWDQIVGQIRHQITNKAWETW